MPTPAATVGTKSTEATLDQANIAMRALPFYQDFLKSLGQNPNSVKLNDRQREQLLAAARANGFQIDTKGMQIDEAGNIDKKGHAVRNTLIVVGIAAAAVAAPYIIPALTSAGGVGMAGGAAGAGASGLGGAGAAGLGAGTMFAGSTGVGLAGATGGALVGGGGAVLGGGLGATSMLGTGALAGGLNAGLSAGATGVGASLPGAMAAVPAYSGTAALPALASSATVPTAATTLGGGTSGTSYLGHLARTGSTGGGSGFIGTGAAEHAGLGNMALRYGLSEGGSLVNGYLQNRAAGKAADVQQRYLDEALAYTKEQDAYKRSADEKAIAVEQQRYGDREGRLAPWRATGISANSKMASLLGLQPTPATSAPTMTNNATPPQAWATPVPMTSTPATSTVNAEVMPDRAAAPELVTMRAPNGQTKTVPADQVAHYTQRGGQVVS